MRNFLNKVALVWGGVAFAGALLSWWTVGACLVQLAAAFMLYALTKPKRPDRAPRGYDALD